MGRGPCTFKKQDVIRAVEAVIAAGIAVGKVEIDREGKIVVVSGKQGEPKGDALDQWMQHHAR